MSDQVYLDDLCDLVDLESAVEAGYVRVQVHPTEPLRIFNYTERCVFDQVWTQVTLACRGLIVGEHGAVVARPFRKFFNYGDPMAGDLDASAQAVVVDKMDGSLGIIYPVSDGWAVATRGSFASEQAIHATALLRSRYPAFTPPSGVTVLAEIVYPANRIVCDYGGADDLFLLGGVDITTGRAIGPDYIPGWAGPAAKVFAVSTLADALAMPPRPGAEGFVVRLVESGAMVKLKQADYVALHKIITGLNARGVWELLGEGKTVADICEPLPDEFHKWVRDLAEDLQLRAEMAHEAARITHDNITEKLDQEHPGGWQRKEYALAVTAWVAEPSKRAWLFNLLDGRDPRAAIWKTLRPAGDMRPVNFSEDVA